MDEQERTSQQAYFVATLLPSAAEALDLKPEEVRRLWEQLRTRLPETEAGYLQTRLVGLMADVSC